LITCAALRTNLTIREIAASFAISKSAAHRIVSTMTPRLAVLGATNVGRDRHDRRESWVVDGTLIPTRDHRRATRSKNDRWSCNAHVPMSSGRAICESSPPPRVAPATATTRCTTAARASRRFASSMVASLPTAATAVSPSWSRRGFADVGSCATEHGGDIVADERG
jgi:hypothetical protein